MNTYNNKVDHIFIEQTSTVIMTGVVCADCDSIDECEEEELIYCGLCEEDYCQEHIQEHMTSFLCTCCNIFYCCVDQALTPDDKCTGMCHECYNQYLRFLQPPNKSQPAIGA